MYTPVNPFYYIKVGFKGVKIIQVFFRDEQICRIYILLCKNFVENTALLVYLRKSNPAQADVMGYMHPAINNAVI